MLFHEIALSRDEILQKVADALQSEEAGIFLDASLLIHCYEISGGARDELLAALTKLGTRVKVPLWAAKETWEHSFRKELKSRPLQTHAVNLANQIKRFSTEARRYVDDESVSQPAPLTKEEYETQLKEAGNTVMKLAGMVSAHERKPEQTAATLIPFFNERLLKSNLIPILARVQGEGALRAKHRIPPGFSDVATSAEDGDAPNRGKVANPHGDLIIWFEILEYVRTQKLKFLVLITRDTTKGDWVYIPRRLNDSKGRPQENTIRRGNSSRPLGFATAAFTS
jgi:hypothetical protein